MSDVEIDDFLSFLDSSPTPFHAVLSMRERLDAAGFESLDEAQAWDLKPGSAYYTTRNDSSIIAFRLGTRPLAEAGVRMVGAHTDSPCLKVKPKPELRRKNMWQLGVEVYGGVLLNPWFDRDLGMAGRVSWLDSEGNLQQSLINIDRPIATIPSLAIHLDREANSQRSVNPQTDMPPLLLLHAQQGEPVEFRQRLVTELNRNGHQAVEALDYELCLYDTQGAAQIGWCDDFIASARLDNLLSCYVGMQALLDQSGDNTAILVCNDHEEVGSQSSSGAQGPMLMSVLKRLCPEAETLDRCLANSMLISADNAHGIHPNFMQKHDENHGPLLNEGPVIKLNANQRYASNSETSGLFRQLCRQANIPVQSFVVRSDMACGSTIGPITAATVGVKTLDIGVPTFGMHSIRELAGSKDVDYIRRALSRFYALESVSIK